MDNNPKLSLAPGFTGQGNYSFNENVSGFIGSGGVDYTVYFSAAASAGATIGPIPIVVILNKPTPQGVTITASVSGVGGTVSPIRIPAGQTTGNGTFTPNLLGLAYLTFSSGGVLQDPAGPLEINVGNLVAE